MEDINNNEEKDENLVNLLKDIRQKLEKKDDKENVKAWKLPFKARVGGSKAKKNWIGVIQVNENKNLEMYKVKIDEGVIEKDKVPHLATSNYVLNWKNKPVLLVPSWSVEPYCPQKNYEEAVNKKTLSAGFKLLANHLEKGQMENKKKLGLTPIIVIAVLAAIGYFAWKSGAFGG